MMPFDTQKHAQRLEQAGFTRRQAEVVTRATQEIVAQNLVTRGELRTFERRLMLRLGALWAATSAVLQHSSFCPPDSVLPPPAKGLFACRILPFGNHCKRASGGPTRMRPTGNVSHVRLSSQLLPGRGTGFAHLPFCTGGSIFACSLLCP